MVENRRSMVQEQIESTLVLYTVHCSLIDDTHLKIRVPRTIISLDQKMKRVISLY